MKVTFVYTDHGKFNQNNFNRGVAILSSCLKQNGHKTSLMHISKHIDKAKFISLIRKHQPDLIAFSFITNMFMQIRKFSLWVKELGIASLHGGMHATTAPEDCLSCAGIDALCRGEGEAAIVDFCKIVESHADMRNIPNIWIKKDGKIYRNACRNFIENLDTLPYPDYELFEYENLEEARLHKVLVTQASRGCLYNCTYCCNGFLHSLYPNRERYLRYYSVDRLLDEVEWFLKKYPFLRAVRFYDDTLTQDKNWFREFALKYKKRIGLPYSSNERVENIDCETALLLKESGCTALDLGVESGDDFIRQRYMNRCMTGREIIDAFSILRSYGIMANSFNILGMVGETPQTVLKTIKLNTLVEPSIVFNAYFYPFKGTQAYNFVRERKYPIIKEEIGSFFERPVVKLDTIKQAQLVFFYKYFYFLMRLYKISWKISGEENKIVKSIDKIITFRFFPYFIFNLLHFGKEDILILVKRYPRIYLFFRRFYHSIKDKNQKIQFKVIFKYVYLTLRRFILCLMPIKIKERNSDYMVINSVLVIRIDRIGDLIMSLPALRTLKQCFPSAKISILVRRGNETFLEGIPGIDEVILYQGFIKTVRGLRKRQFALAIDFLMDYPLKTALLAYLSKAKLVTGFDIAGRGRFFNLKLSPVGEKKHISQHILDLVRVIVKAYSDRDIAATSFYPEIPISKQNREEFKSFLKEKGIETEGLLVGIHPGGYYPSQRWLVERFSELADRIIKKYKAKVIVVGNTDEKPIVEKMLSLMQEEAVKVIGLSLDRLVSLISLMNLFICNNSGPLHIACALKIPTVSTMGPTDPVLWWPMGEKHIVVRRNLFCSPCNFGFCKEHKCMELITVEEMEKAVDIQIQRAVFAIKK